MPQVIAVGAGKGGVGKSFVSANLGITLAKLQYKTLVVDLDLSCANLHTTLGMHPQTVGIKDYFEFQKPLKDLCVPTPIPHLQLLQGFWDQWSPVQLSTGQISKFMDDLRCMSFDAILIDLGPGATHSNLEVFRKADNRLIVTSPEPTSVEKTYRFIEAYVWENVQSYIPENQKEAALKLFSEYRTNPIKPKISALQFLSDQIGNQMIDPSLLMKNSVSVLVNETRSALDQNLGHAIKSVCFKFFQLPVEDLGFLDHDNAVWQSVRNREPFLVAKPFTPLSGQLLHVAKLLTTKDLHAQILRPAV